LKAQALAELDLAADMAIERWRRLVEAEAKGRRGEFRPLPGGRQ
jgi:hypothetical protein